MFRMIATTAALALLAATASAETIEVKMVGDAANGPVAFEPAFVQAAPGDTIRFVETGFGHNVETIPGMLPDGVVPVKSAYGEDYELTVDHVGLYGIKGTMRYTVGMVGLIQVGDAVNYDQVAGVPQKGRARGAMSDLLKQVNRAGF